MIANFDFAVTDVNGNKIGEIDRFLMAYSVVISALQRNDNDIGDRDRKSVLADNIKATKQTEVTADDVATLLALTDDHNAFSPLLVGCIKDYLNTIG
jgi:hypothetical protein